MPAVASPARQVVMVPSEVTWTYTAAAGWRPITMPPAWWLAEQEELLAADERRRSLRLAPALAPLPGRATSCRPGSGPCWRRHEHASSRRMRP